ncbi:MAG TPA: dTDP-4-dehydrorhamnose 3,5-epimerase [Longimicrobiales bacterium]
MLQVTRAAIPDVKVLVPQRHRDARGFLSQVFDRRALEQAGITAEFVQENHSYSSRVGTVRGLHFQLAPRAQGKLVRVCRGAIYDVALDLRRAAPTFGRHVAVVLSAAEWNQLYIPPGFAHGFCTLEPDTEVLYKLTDFYAPEYERGVRWDDPTLGIDWPAVADVTTLSERDRRWPPLAELQHAFE